MGNCLQGIAEVKLNYIGIGGNILLVPDEKLGKECYNIHEKKCIF